MNLYPAIDLRDGKVVRLLKGDFDAETIYGDDPVATAQAFEAAGAAWVHVVDLDAAKTGAAHNRDVVAAIAGALNIPVQSGGGVRDYESAVALLQTGVARIVIGTAAHENPELVDRLAAEFPGRIAVGLDARGGRVATRGWVADSDVTTLDMVRRFEHVGVAAFIVTDIERDGTLGGPDVDGLKAILDATSVDLIASGGVGELGDLLTLANVRSGTRFIAGAIVGKAIYENRFDVAEAVTALDMYLPEGAGIVSLARPAVQAMDGYRSARTEGKQYDVRIFLDANENPYPPYPADGSTDGYNRYPAVQPLSLRRLFAERYGCDASSIFLSRGADEAIDLLVRIFCSEDVDAVMVCPPAFPMYVHSAAVQGARVVEVPLTAGEFQLDVPAVRAAIQSDAHIKLVFVTSPGNPTSRLLQYDDMVSVANALEGQGLLVVDELYLDYSDGASMAGALAAHENVVVLRSLSKERSLAGERFGVTVAHPAVVDLLTRVAAPYLFTQSSLAVVERMMTPDGETYAASVIERILAERQRVAEVMRALPAVQHVYASDANFLLVRFADPRALVHAMEAAGIKVRDRSSVPQTPGCVRISIGTPDDNDAMLAVVRDMSNGLSKDEGVPR